MASLGIFFFFFLSHYVCITRDGDSGNTRAKNRVPLDMRGCGSTLRERPDSIQSCTTSRDGWLRANQRPCWTNSCMVTSGNTDYVKARVDRLGSDGGPIRGARLSRDGAGPVTCFPVNSRTRALTHSCTHAPQSRVQQRQVSTEYQIQGTQYRRSTLYMAPQHSEVRLCY